jgi:ABC-type thiamin/hydroxymethylpyrimidine transport system permease subunit
MARDRTAARTGTRTGGLHPFHFGTNTLIWLSAVIVMGIVSYFISQNRQQSNHVIYIEVISVLTVAFFVFSFFLGRFARFILPFNIIFSYLWLVAVVFTAEDWSNSYSSALEKTVEAFSFIAL